MTQDRKWKSGEKVRIRSGGAEMEFLGVTGEGLAICKLKEKTFHLPVELLCRLTEAGAPRRRKGRVPGQSPHSSKASPAR